MERKRLDDLSSSIIDGRFHEQKVPMLASLCAPSRLLSGSSSAQGSPWPLRLASELPLELHPSGRKIPAGGSEQGEHRGTGLDRGAYSRAPPGRSLE